MESLQVFGGVLVISAIVVLQLQQERVEMSPALIRARGRRQKPVY
jgi:hypothetical protein